MTEERYNILVVSDNSGRGEGGVEVFNQELSEALARRHNVTLFTANPDMPQHEGIQRVVQTQPPEGVERRDWIEHLAGQDPTAQGLEDPASQPYDIIIGHSRFSGPAAAEMRENWYQDARVVHFLHTSPERLPFVKGLSHEEATEKAAKDSSIERLTMARADVAAGVGPLLSEASRQLSADGANIPHSHEVIPGTHIYDPVQHDPAPERLNLLVMGRVSDPLKGMDDAAEAVALLNEAGLSVHLTVRGVKDEELASATARIAQLSGGNATVKGRTRNVEELNEDIRNSHAVIMPSKHEGYGMVAPEGLAHGVPVLVNEESGAALFFQDTDRVPAEIGQRCVVPEPTDGNSRANAWMTAINQLSEDLPQRQADALHLREVLQQYSWDHAAEALVQTTMEQTPLPQRGPESMLTVQQRDAARTVQGPNGQVIRPEVPEQGQQAPQQGVIGQQRQGPGQESPAQQSPGQENPAPQQAAPQQPAPQKPAPEAPRPAWQAGFTHNQPATESAPRPAAPEKPAPSWQAGFTHNQPGAANRRGPASPGPGAGGSGPARPGPEQQAPQPPAPRGNDGIGM
ncbi:glycosyltransferase [Streptomyces sp. P9(2023)]|uniref:glycosyltransferase family 4 protein n=1 Tax=Streptomyces sp. P9(2023) TaxID=3064394 RepID=UPI0028F3F3BF|nr:glycosyltransferase [Streptomyces sp. P9(2023)]MDT9691740.1 glycosyltransferase [Streptomyces sp. P9(2023)]